MKLFWSIFFCVFSAGLMAQDLKEREIAQMCLRAGSAVSSAAADSYKDKFNGPEGFDYSSLDFSLVAKYEEYISGANPSPKEAYKSFILSLAATEESILRNSNYSVTIRNTLEAKQSLFRIKKFLLEGGSELDWGDSFISFKSDKQDIAHKDKFFTAACLWVLGGSECKKSLQYLDDSINRSQSRLGDTMYPRLINLYLVNEKLRAYLITVGLKMVELFENYLKDESVPERDLFDILTHELEIKNGLSRTKSRRVALEILAVYGVRGATWFNKGIGGTNNAGRSLTSILLLTSAIQFFDKITYQRTGRQFSIPRQIKGNCYYGKNYHFWTAAYLAYDANAFGGFSVKNSIRASHLLGVGYEVGRVGNYFQSYSSIPLEWESFYSDGANAVRLDLAFNTLGAWFGAFGSSLYGRFTNINSSIAYSKILKKSSRVKAAAVNRMNFYREFIFIHYYAPNAHLNYVLKHLD